MMHMLLERDLAGRRRLKCWFGLLAVMMFTVDPAMSRQSGKTVSPEIKSATSQDDQRSSDIVVTGMREGSYAVKVRATAQSGPEESLTRQAASNARIFSRCVQPSDSRLLNEIMNGLPNRDRRIAATDALISAHMACYPGFTPNWTWTKHRYEQSIFDRGAIVERILALYAPDLAMTATELRNPAVITSLHVREDRLNKTRSSAERLYANVTICLVARHPDIALRLLHSMVNSKDERQMIDALIGTSPACVGEAKSVSVDPPEFRVFLADAVYSWAVALRDGDSLVPLGGR